MTKNSLAEIIESLTANEKRNFYLSYSGSKEPNYFQVYKVLEKNTKLGNQEVHKMVLNKKMNVSYEKAYLHKMLARSLRNFYEDKTAEITLHQNLIDIEILYNKSLLKSCMEVIVNSKALAEKHDAFLMSLKLLHWELKCRAQAGDFLAFGKFVEEKAKAEIELHARQTDYENAVHQNARLVAFFMTQGLSKSSKNKHRIPVKLNTLQSGFKKAKSFVAFLQYAESLIFYYTTSGKMKEGIAISEKVLAKYDQNPDYKYLYTAGYISNLGNYCQHVIFFEVTEKVKARIAEYGRIPEDTKMIIPEAMHKQIALSVRIMLYDLHAKEGDFVTTLPPALKDAENFSAVADELRADLATSLCIITVNSLMLNGYSDKALPVINYSINRFRDQTRLDLYFCFQSLYLMAQFDIKNYEVLPSLIQGAHRFFKSRALEIKAPYLILQMLTELINLSPKKQLPVLEKYFQEFLALSDNIDEDFFLGSSKILYWINRKVEK